jgi:hypothetical protein
MSESSTPSQEGLSYVESLQLDQPEQFTYVRPLVDKLVDACPEEQETDKFVADNLVLVMATAAEESQSRDVEAIYASIGKPHQIAYGQILRSVAEAGQDYTPGTPEEACPTPYHRIFKRMYEYDQAKDESIKVYSYAHDLERQLRHAAVHIRVTHQELQPDASGSQEYRNDIENGIILPITESLLEEDVALHPKLATYYAHRKRLSMIYDRSPEEMSLFTDLQAE